MKKLLVVLAIVAGIGLGFVAGYYTAIHSIVDVQKSEAGFQVTFADGNGYWYEYDEPQQTNEYNVVYDDGIYYVNDVMMIAVDNVAYIKSGEYDYWELMLNDDYRYDHFVTQWERETGYKAQRNGSAEWILD